jgi:hypothetical protein
MRRLSLALLLLQLSFTAFADTTADELQKLYAALNMLDQQQQAIYQQFQMVHELRLSGVPRLPGTPIYLPPSGQIANYDEMVEAQRNAIQRAEYLHQRADDLLTRYSEIEELKEPLQLRIYELTLKQSGP